MILQNHTYFFNHIEQLIYI